MERCSKSAAIVSLGLSIAKRFIDLQGGTIAVSAQPEEDFETEIVVTLPLA